MTVVGRRSSRWVTGASALVLLLGVSACGQGGGRAGQVGDPARPGESAESGGPYEEGPDPREAPDPALERFYSQEAEWEGCERDFECAVIEVPLDYAKPDGETIEIKLLKNPADSEGDRVGSMVVNPGGPGAPGSAYAGEQATYAFGNVLRNQFDIVGFDPRGTGESSPVDCLSDAELDSYIGTDPDPDTPAEVAELNRQVAAMGRGCVAKSGVRAQHVSTHEAARDMDIIRAVLEERKLTYFGASYGTKLGAVYADLFPERAGRMVLDGGVDLSLPSRDMSLQQAAGFETALTAYLEDCLSGDCYLGADMTAAKKRIKDFLAQLEQQPLTVDDRQLTSGWALYGIILPLYVEDYWAVLDQRLGAALEGDGAGLLELADLYHSRNEDGTFEDNSSEAIYLINCTDDPWAIPAAQVPAQIPAFEQASPTFGRIFAWGLVGCAGLPFKPAVQDWKGIDAAGADPLLVIGTTRDPATPMQWSRNLAAQLESAVLITRDGDGHTGYNVGNGCVDEIVELYLVEGEVPEKDVTCEAE